MNPITILAQRLTDIFNLIGSDIGDLEQLQTADTWSLVRAINEVATKLDALEARVAALEAQ